MRGSVRRNAFASGLHSFLPVWGTSRRLNPTSGCFRLSSCSYFVPRQGYILTSQVSCVPSSSRDRKSRSYLSPRRDRKSLSRSFRLKVQSQPEVAPVFLQRRAKEFAGSRSRLSPDKRRKSLSLLRPLFSDIKSPWLPGQLRKLGRTQLQSEGKVVMHRLIVDCRCSRRKSLETSGTLFMPSYS